jgi:hypothetical protein
MADESKPAIDFITFVVSLGSSVFVHLGEAPHPETGEPLPANLPLAKQTIDILDMLRAKTKGNLTEEEERFLENLLTDLRLRYVGRAAGKAQ